MPQTPRPVYLLFAGVNGAGKTTLYHSDVWRSCALGVEGKMERVNPDEIAVKNHCGPIRAGKMAVAQVNRFFEIRHSFNQETTLAGKSAIKNIMRAKQLGYKVVLLYVGLSSPQLAIERIAHRVEVGGHDIDTQAVHRRFDFSLRNVSQAVHLCDEAILFDNTQRLTTIARWENGTLCWWGAAAKDSWLTDAMENGSW